jgi:hypothetical protein
MFFFKHGTFAFLTTPEHGTTCSIEPIRTMFEEEASTTTLMLNGVPPGEGVEEAIAELLRS